MLSTTLTDDEASFEESDAPAGMGYQDAVGQAQDAYRKAKAQADHDLAIGGTQAAYDAEMAAAEEARTAGYDLAYEDFATLVAPLITTQGLGDAAAELLDAQTVAGSSLTDITDNNQAVDGYQDAESTDYDGEQRADAQALDDYNVANANGHAAAIAAFAQANPSPWADLASATAAAEAAQQLAQALAQLTQSNALADAQMYQEQTQDDALEGEDNALAQAESDQATTDALAEDGAATAAAENPDAVFEDLPDTLIAPAEGPTPTLTPNRYYIYQTGDPALYAYETPFAGMVLADGLTGGSGGIAGSASGPWTEPYFGAPNFMPDDLGVPGFAYDWQGYGQQIPFGLLGTFTVSSGSAEFQGATSIVEGDGVGIGDGGIGVPELDLVRTDQRTAGHPSIPISAISDTRVHFSGDNASLLNVTNTPSAIGVGGYSQAQIPTSPQALLLASTGTTSEAGSSAGSAGSSPVQLLSEPAAGANPVEQMAFADRATEPEVDENAALRGLEEVANEVKDSVLRDKDEIDRQVEMKQAGGAAPTGPSTDPFRGYSSDQLLNAPTEEIPIRTHNGKTIVVEFGGNPVSPSDGGKAAFGLLNAAIDAAVTAKGGDPANVVEYNAGAWTGKPATVTLPNGMTKTGLADVEGFIDGELPKATNGLTAGDTVRVIIIGYSYGAESAIEAVRRTKEVLDQKGLNAEISLVFIDGTTQPHGASYPGIPNDVKAILGGAKPRFGNYYQREDQFNIAGKEYRGVQHNKLGELKQEDDQLKKGVGNTVHIAIIDAIAKDAMVDDFTDDPAVVVRRTLAEIIANLEMKPF